MLAIAGATVLQQRAHSSSTWRHGVSGQLTAFERVGRGALIVDSSARILDLNARVRWGDGLHVAGGVLQASTATDRRRLRGFLSTILSGAKPASGTAATVALSRPSGLRPWLLDGMDCSAALHDPRTEAAALILITDVEEPYRLSPQLLAQVFGLTCTEARLAVELASGKPLSAVAQNLSISAGHARQRLKAIFGKTGTSRQGELIALLAKLN